jgi:hypothetical protein
VTDGRMCLSICRRDNPTCEDVIPCHGVWISEAKYLIF